MSIRVRGWGHVPGTTAVMLAALAAGACSRPSRLDALRDGLLGGDATSALSGAPSCAGAAGARASDACLSSVATWFGGKKGFQLEAPDQASAATAAVAVARDGHGEELSTPDKWFFVLRNGEGPGGDALRLAISGRMAADAPTFARTMDSDADARAVMKAVAASIPGACGTYAVLGAGTDDATLPPQERVDHSPCVQKDLMRATGPAEHGRYGMGLWRGATAALTLWKDAASSLRVGVSKSDAKVQAALATRVAAIDGALAKIALKEQPPAPDITQFMDPKHADPVVDAGPRGGAGLGTKVP